MVVLPPGAWSGIWTRDLHCFCTGLCSSIVRGLEADQALQQSGWVQTIVLLLIEVTLFVAMVFFTPYLKRSSNGSNIALSILRVMVSAILIVFNPSITLNEITRFVLLPS